MLDLSSTSLNISSTTTSPESNQLSIEHFKQLVLNGFAWPKTVRLGFTPSEILEALYSPQDKRFAIFSPEELLGELDMNFGFCYVGGFLALLTFVRDAEMQILVLPATESLYVVENAISQAVSILGKTFYPQTEPESFPLSDVLDTSGFPSSTSLPESSKEVSSSELLADMSLPDIPLDLENDFDIAPRFAHCFGLVEFSILSPLQRLLISVPPGGRIPAQLITEFGTKHWKRLMLTTWFFDLTARSEMAQRAYELGIYSHHELAQATRTWIAVLHNDSTNTNYPSDMQSKMCDCFFEQSRNPKTKFNVKTNDYSFDRLISLTARGRFQALALAGFSRAQAEMLLKTPLPDFKDGMAYEELVVAPTDVHGRRSWNNAKQIQNKDRFFVKVKKTHTSSGSDSQSKRRKANQKPVADSAPKQKKTTTKTPRSTEKSAQAKRTKRQPLAPEVDSFNCIPMLMDQGCILDNILLPGIDSMNAFGLDEKTVMLETYAADLRRQINEKGAILASSLAIYCDLPPTSMLNLEEVAAYAVRCNFLLLCGEHYFACNHSSFDIANDSHFLDVVCQWERRYLTPQDLLQGFTSLRSLFRLCWTVSEFEMDYLVSPVLPEAIESEFLLVGQSLIPNAGRGLFARRPLPAGLLVGYRGRIQPQMCYGKDERVVYGVSISGDLVVDALSEDGSTLLCNAAFINHAENKDALMDPIDTSSCSEAPVHLSLRAACPAGVELSFDYGGKYWTSSEQPESVTCPEPMLEVRTAPPECMSTSALEDLAHENLGLVF